MAFKKVFGGGARFPAEWLIVGLGNPGEGYARNRHNIGFWVINDLAKRAAIQPKVTGSLMAIGVGQLVGVKVALVKPRTYVNLSGKAIAQARGWTGCDLAHTVVVYDELDLKTGALRIRLGGGTGGHNGLKSIVELAGGSDFVRVRVGIGRPVRDGEPTWDPDAVADYVLSDPRGDDRQILEDAARAAADAVEAVMTEGVDAAAARFNRK